MAINIETEKQGVARMSDWPGASELTAYFYTGGAAIMGRLMFHARQVQRGKRKAMSWELMFDVPVALAMGWMIYGLCIWFGVGPQATVSAAIAAGYLGPYSVDRVFDRVLATYIDREPAE